MPTTVVMQDELLDLLFLNLDFDNIGDAGGILQSVAPGNLEFSLHTATLVDSDIQTTSEAAYTNYTRIDVVRGAAEWTVVSGLVDNDNAITFPNSGSGPESEIDFGMGSDIVANELWVFGALSATLVVNSGVQPEFAAGDLDITVT
jgi:hypothetical protein